MPDISHVHVTKSRHVIPYGHFLNTADRLLEVGRSMDTTPSYFFLASLSFRAFALEAFLNHIGTSLFESWPEIERKLEPKSKLALIAEKLEIKVDYGSQPWQLVPELMGFRNQVVHGKSEVLTDEYVVPIEEHFEEVFVKFMWADWEEFSTEANASRVKRQLEELIRFMWKAAELEGDPLGLTVMQERSAKGMTKEELSNNSFNGRRR